jgi:hypothetical protein
MVLKMQIQLVIVFMGSQKKLMESKNISNSKSFGTFPIDKKL